MRKLTYFAVFEPHGAGGYGVYFPDIMGCTSFGETYEATQKMALASLSVGLCRILQDLGGFSGDLCQPFGMSS